MEKMNVNSGSLGCWVEFDGKWVEVTEQNINQLGLSDLKRRMLLYLHEGTKLRQDCIALITAAIDALPSKRFAFDAWDQYAPCLKSNVSDAKEGDLVAMKEMHIKEDTLQVESEFGDLIPEDALTLQELMAIYEYQVDTGVIVEKVF